MHKMVMKLHIPCECFVKGRNVHGDLNNILEIIISHVTSGYSVKDRDVNGDLNTASR